MTNIYVVSHKRADLATLNLPDCYRKIRVGNHNELLKDELCDNSHPDNISDKNNSYCELTALYWMWKYDLGSDYIGLVHYRRFFTKYSLRNSAKGILKENDIAKIMGKYDIIVPPKAYFWKGTVEAYLKTGYEKDLNITGNAIKDLYPEYLPFWNKLVVNSSNSYLYNMFIMKRQLMGNYCKWLFDILGYVENNVDLSTYEGPYKRIFGYIAERLLGVWIEKNGLRPYHARVINTEKCYGKSQYLKQIVKNIHLSDWTKDTYYNLYRLGLIKGKNGS